MCNKSNRKCAPTPKTYIHRTNLKIASWNINGVGGTNQDKLKDKKFIQEVQSHDIIALSETHCAKNKYVCLPGYYTYQSHISYPGKRAIGGIALLIRKSIKPGVHIVKDANDYIWLKLEKTFFGLERDLFICAAYIPPERSNYLRIRGYPDILDQITSDIADFTKEGHVMLMGDLNARTANLQDHITTDSDKFIDPDTLSYLIDQPLSRRNSQDKTADPRGRQLIDVCIQSRLRILNGRCLGDTCGYFTCHKSNGSSVVDYFIVNEELLSRVLCFKVHMLLENMSDHCQISVLVKTNFTPLKNSCDLTDTVPGDYYWKEGDIQKFQNALAEPDTQEKILKLMSSNYNTQNGPNSAVDDLQKILIHTAGKALQRKRSNPSPLKFNNHKPWFDKPLQILKREIGKKAQLLCLFPNDPNIRGSYYKIVKIYNKTRKQKKRAHKQEIINKLEHMRTERPSEFWKVLNLLKSEEMHENPASNISHTEWSEYFKDLNHNKATPNLDLRDKTQKLLENIPDNILNDSIQENEIIKAISNLKNKKAQGLDKIRNEMLRYSQHILLPCLVKVFNIILQSGSYPDMWAHGYISPIFKTGNPFVKDNYRGITITSCLGKLFNSVLNSRLNRFLEVNDTIPEAQIAYRSNCRPSDHLFVLKTLIDKMLKKDKRHLFACFVDFRKAFDSISHEALLFKLASVGIGDKFHQLIKTMNQKTQLRVKIANNLSAPFPSNIGVRQGDNLSPNLFKIFTHDLVNIIDPECEPPKLISKEVGCLLFADDAILLSSSAKGLQKSLNNLQKYCDEWGLVVNTTKTKSMTFNINGKKMSLPLKYNNEPIESVQEYKYLGTLVTANGAFTKSCEDLYHRGLKAFFKLRRQLSQGHIKCSTYLHLFDTIIKPVLLYSSEIWMPCVAKLRKLQNNSAHNIEESFENLHIEKLHCLLLRILLNVNAKATKMALYSETGRYPLYIEGLVNSFKYLNRLETGDCSSLLTESLACSKELANSWHSNLMKVLNKLNITCSHDNTITAKAALSTLRIRFGNYWHKRSFESTTLPCHSGKKLRTYQLFKQNICLEKYLDMAPNKNAIKALAQFRISAHNLNIETGRYLKLPVEQRLCTMCDLNTVEDEVHFLIACTAYSQKRQPLFNSAKNSCQNFDSLTDLNKFIWLLSAESKDIITTTAEFLNLSFKQRNDKLGIK